MRLAWAANESQFYSSRFRQSRLNRFYQPRARFSARDSFTRLDFARAGHCRSRLGSPRLGLTRLSILGSGLAGGSVSGLGNQLDARLGSARSLARTQLGVRLEIGSGLATRDLVWLGSEESELSSSHLDRSIARPIWSRLISVRKLL